MPASRRAGSAVLRLLRTKQAAVSAVHRYAAGAATGATGAAAGPAGAAAAATAGSGQVLRMLGYKVPYTWIIGASLASGVGAYAYVTTRIATHDRQPLSDVALAAPVYLPHEIVTTDQGGTVDLARHLAGKHAVLAFGAVHAADAALQENIARAAEAASKRTGAAVTPVFISLDPGHGRPADLKLAAGRSASTLVVADSTNGLLTCAERFKNQAVARQFAAEPDQERKKKGKDLTAGGFASDSVYVVDTEGRFVGLVDKHASSSGMAAAVANTITRDAPGSG